MNGAAGGWHDPATARWYRAFERRHGRYRHASHALARHAALAPGLRVLDLAAGTGATAAALLPALGQPLRLDCVEPSLAMREAGRARLGEHAGLRWLASLDEAEPAYDRIVCSAALWQWPSLRQVLHALAARLAPGGALVFNIPAAYLGQPDGPGGGSDPWLTELPLRLGPALALEAPASAGPQVSQIDAWLAEDGLHAQRWQQRQRLSQAAWIAWHKIPVITDARWPGLDAEERARRIDAAAQGLDRASWRPERWLGWTAWKPAFRILPLSAAQPEDPGWVHEARAAGAALLRGVLPPRRLAALCRLVLAAGIAQQLLDRQGRWIGGTAPAPHEIPRWVALQQQLALTPEFQALVVSPRLTALVSQLLGRPARGGFGSVVRIAPPEHLVPATAAHRDAEFLREADGVWSAWLPLQACAVEDGVLAVAPGSQHGGGAPAWAASPMQPGDVLLLSAQTLHRGCPNRRLREPRLSIDLRFGPA